MDKKKKKEKKIKFDFLSFFEFLKKNLILYIYI